MGRFVASASALLVALLVACSSTEDDAAPEDGGTTTTSAEECGRLLTKCKEGGPCAGAADCESDICREGTCRAARAPDGTKDDDETDVDCGGASSPACADGKACTVASDCKSGVCTGGTCQVPTSTDGVQNGDETGVDCGGSTTSAPRCATGAGCLVDGDCDGVRCDVNAKKCAAAGHEDGIKNLGETGVDCGGTTGAKRCPTGETCVSTDDCDNVLCNDAAKTCDPPTATDKLKNGTETDVDCGGGAPANAPKCFIGEGCAVAGDCMSGACSAGLGGKCSPPSCGTTETAGIATCGTGETGQAGAKHESCCKSLPLPTRTTKRLDKYEITAGRFRTFLASVGANVRGWVQAYATAHPTSQLAAFANDPIVDGSTNAASTLLTLYPAADRFDPHSLTAHMAIDIDNYSGIRGCANYEGSYSANTYWMDNTHYADFGLPPRTLPRTVSDEKPLNCAMPIMYVAFCAWDGGELATLADYHDAWAKPPNTYPWGATAMTRPTFNWCNGPYKNGGFLCQCDGATGGSGLTSWEACPAGGFTNLSEAGIFYEYPPNTDRATDNSPLIAAPGRFPGDATVAKGEGESWYDFWANLAEYTGDLDATFNDEFCDYSVEPGAGATKCARKKENVYEGTRYTGIPRVGLIGNSWEGHKYEYGTAKAIQATFQYGKFGGRCVRPANPY